MRYTYYNRLDVRTGNVEALPFSDIDGRRYGICFERGSTVAYDELIALRIVNGWNYINSIQPNTSHVGKFIFWV